ncbi:rod shape determining protein RodA [Desulfotomaculum arcticum]|uniref:Peptidoglycan glycosyltransferase RodA n=1 Tax=Desulfotruncus arcticus DSM 17038 TaxID=1121424 RepID=A0A1I2UHF5_9FIRM|nr:rod shape-determining protein RodA [Desulfotruncus arcticus]SFG76594.1 rod shape determining protein RodA [Desulfotomaculum arcticum] [Desulfotruncus arcticus DSM 17038]
MNNKRLIKNLDFTLIGVTAIIIIWSLIVIGSASTDYGWWMRLGFDMNKLQEASVFQRLLWMKKEFVYKQFISVLIGTCAAMAVVYIPYEDWRKYTKHLYVINLLMLGSVLVLGQTAMGAQRWIDIGFFRFQPSESAKLIIIIVLADFLANKEGKLRNFKELLPCFVYVGLPMGLILLQPDLGTSLVFTAILFGMLFIASSKPLLITGIFSGGLAAVIGLVWSHLKFGTWIPLHDYQLNRLIIFLDPWSDIQGAGYHVIQSQIAIGSSGLWGKGLLRGTQSFLEFLPIRHTDFIFSVLAEEFGFLGAFLLLCLFAVFLYRGVRIAAESKDLYGTLIAVGIVSMFTFQILVNIGMTIAIMPVTGLPLPLFSYGGSSMVTNLLAIGALINIYLRRQKNIF